MNNTAFFTDPTKLANATREATLSSIEGALALHKEMQTATWNAWEQARAEGVRLADAQGKAIQQTLDAQRQATEKSLHWLREQVVRTETAKSAKV